MRRIIVLLIILIGLLMIGLVMAQEPQPGFEEVTRLGKIRPRGLQYDVNFDRLVWVDALGRLQLIDATDFSVQYTLYESGFFNAYQFSHDGRYLALAIDVRVEIWDTQTGTLLTSFEPDGALRAEGPLYWSPDDGVLSLNTQVRAPQAIRQSENDTTNLPWLWDIASELEQRRTVLPGARAIPFFDYRNGFVYGANNKAIIGLPERLQLLDISPDGVNVAGDIPASRFERDPIYAWESLRDDMLYVRPDDNSSTLIQIDTATGNQVSLPIGRDLDAYTLNRIEALKKSRLSRIIGDPNNIDDIGLVRLLLGDDYRGQFAYHPITVTLIDILEPQTPTSGDGASVLLYLFDEARGVGRLDLITYDRSSALTISPNNDMLAIRRTNSPARIEVYDLDSGALIQRYLPAMPEVAMNGILAFTADSAALLNDFQRFDLATGKVIYEDLQYNNGYDYFTWDDDSRSLITVTGSRWWEWDLATGEVIRRETLNAFGNTVDTSPNGKRLLQTVSIEGNEGPANTYEIVDIGAESRSRITFDSLPGVSIEQVTPSPDWQNYLVVYGSQPYDQHAPGNRIMLYNIDRGALWYVAGDDLPYLEARQYGWLDNETVYIYSEQGTAAPERIYGVDYHPSGLPQCLVDAFSEDSDIWIPVWERFNQRLSPDRLNFLSQSVCSVLPANQQAVEAYLFPTATATSLPVTATPSTIAGVPVCLTNRFGAEARDYAQIWQELTTGLTDEETAEMEVLLCENLSGSNSPQRPPRIVTSNVAVMTIDVETGMREIGSYIPTRPSTPPPNVELVAEAFRRQYGNFPIMYLSPDQTLLAVADRSNQIVIYRLLTTYNDLAINATATVAIVEEAEEEARVLSLRPTATQSFSYLGEPRPTMTPTVTPTAPPRPQATVAFTQLNQVEEVCPFDERFTLSNPAPGYEASGRIITYGPDGVRHPGVLFPADGQFVLDDTLPPCYSGGANCQFSFDHRWMYYITNAPELIVSRPDGSEAQTLFYDNQMPYEVASDFTWLDEHIFQYQFYEYELERSPDPIPYYQRIDFETGTIFEPVSPASSASYNGLSTWVVSTQPGADSRFMVLRTSFSTGRGEGYRYFIYDRDTEQFDYFSRVADAPMGEMIFGWHPLGTMLYYRYPNEVDWYTFDPATQVHGLYGELFLSGEWSPNGRYHVSFDTVYGEALEEHIENNQPVPQLTVWDSQNGLKRRYCIPGLEEYALNQLAGELLWSPESRYLAFQLVLPEDQPHADAPLQTFILDTHNGSVTQVSDIAERIRHWIEDEGGYQ